MSSGKSTKSVICGLALAVLLALPVHADEGSPSLWEVLADALAQLLAGDEDPEAGLSHEPGG